MLIMSIKHSYLCTIVALPTVFSDPQVLNIHSEAFVSPEKDPSLLPFGRQQMVVVPDKCSLCDGSIVPLNQPRFVPGLYPPATSELTVYPSHNKAHSAEDILIRSAERLVLI